MTMERESHPVRAKPRIVVEADDYARLNTLARAAMARLPDLAAGLAEELDRAEVLPDGVRAEHIVCMGCRVAFRDDATGKRHDVVLVYPDQADISAGKISVLTPVGTALLGLRTGDAIDWETPSGEPRSLTVLQIRAAGADLSPPAG